MRKLLIPLLTLLTTAGFAAFSPRTAEERAQALGDLADAPATLRPLLTPDDDFGLIPLPERGDWLATQVEAGQTFAAFRAGAANRPTAARRVIYLWPLGEFADGSAPELATVRRYAEIFFQMEVRTLPPFSPEMMQFEPRVNPQTKRVQWLTRSIRQFLAAHLPDDAFCVLGITMMDLYPKAAWNYVFGEASLLDRVGVYSFARFDPDFFDEERPADFRSTLLRRSLKVLAHEAGHMFGLAHCIYYDCALNGSNSLEESDRRSVELCPVCLRKLQFSVGLDAAKRYAELADFYRRQGWTEDAAWCDRQAAKAGRR